MRAEDARRLAVAHRNHIIALISEDADLDVEAVDSFIPQTVRVDITDQATAYRWSWSASIYPIRGSNRPTNPEVPQPGGVGGPVGSPTDDTPPT